MRWCRLGRRECSRILSNLKVSCLQLLSEFDAVLVYRVEIDDSRVVPTVTPCS